jgi:hypothetical protein
MKTKELIKKAHDLAKPFRIANGEKFRMKDVDPGDTLGFKSEAQPRVKEALARGVSFKSLSAEELDHDYLWRCMKCLPNRGRIGIFNRSYYEEALVVRVHPEFLAKQKVRPGLVTKRIGRSASRTFAALNDTWAATASWW